MNNTIERLVTDPRFHDILSIVKGARNGLVYGAKVRFPHALVMTILFRKGSLESKVKFILNATKQHALNLAKFASIYKTTLLVQKTMNGGKARDLDTFFAGLLGGWIVFGNRNAINEQIVLYILSRVVMSFIPRSSPPRKPLEPRTAAFPPGLTPPGFPYPATRSPSQRWFEVVAALSWGCVMYIFRKRRDTLQSGLTNSMQFIYLDSEVWTDLRTLLWRNR